MKLVITGALGHIGSRLIRDLVPAFPGADLVLVDNLCTRRYASLFDLPAQGRYRFRELDIVTADLERVFEGAEAVIHLAALTDAAGSFGREQEVARVNGLGTERVADACLRTGSPLVFASTTSVYGPTESLVDEDCPDAELRPQSPYADYKLRAERVLRALGRESGLRYVICRLGTVFGVSPGMRFHTAVNRFCWQAAGRMPLTVWRTALNQQRPYLDLADTVGALVFILRRRLYSGETINVVTLNASVGELIERIRARIPDVEVRLVDSPIMNQLSYRVSSRRLASLGFEYRGDLARGIDATLALLAAAGGREARSIG